jgi:hypothetical protein
MGILGDICCRLFANSLQGIYHSRRLVRYGAVAVHHCLSHWAGHAFFYGGRFNEMGRRKNGGLTA